MAANRRVCFSRRRKVHLETQNMNRYPATSQQHMHVARAYVPEDVAKALAVSPLLVQKAVETFYTRDGLQLRVRFTLFRRVTHRH